MSGEFNFRDFSSSILCAIFGFFSNGLISSLYGPEIGPKGDWKLWQNSGLEEILRRIFRASSHPLRQPSTDSSTSSELLLREEWKILYLYGDPVYAPSFGILGPYRAGGRRSLTAQEQATNIKMSSYRIVIEWGFANILNQFTSVEWKRNQKIGLSPIAVNYVVSVLLYNCQTCLRGRNQISDQFGNGIPPPSLETYLACKIALLLNSSFILY